MIKFLKTGSTFKQVANNLKRSHGSIKSRFKMILIKDTKNHDWNLVKIVSTYGIVLSSDLKYVENCMDRLTGKN